MSGGFAFLINNPGFNGMDLGCTAPSSCILSFSGFAFLPHFDLIIFSLLLPNTVLATEHWRMGGFLCNRCELGYELLYSSHPYRTECGASWCHSTLT